MSRLMLALVVCAVLVGVVAAARLPRDVVIVERRPVPTYIIDDYDYDEMFVTPRPTALQRFANAVAALTQ